MTNYEHYKEEIDKIWGIGKSISVTNKGVEKCIETKCKDCLLSNEDDCCNLTRDKWLVSEYKDPADDVDWSRVQVDTPIFVKLNKYENWKPRYFAKYENGIIYSFCCGATSWSYDRTDELYPWKYAKFANPEELKPQIHQKSTMSKEELMDELCEQYKDSCQKSASKEMFDAVEKFWNNDINDIKKQKIANMVMELLKMEE